MERTPDAVKGAAIVTGSGRGIGAAIASRLAQIGHPVMVCDLIEDQAEATTRRINRHCGRVIAYSFGVDVTDERRVQQLVETVIQRFGHIHTLVNNAGILYPTRAADISLAEWNSVINVNLTGAFLCSRTVIPHMAAAGQGRIINMSSSAGRSVSTIGGAHYTAAKAGVLGLTRALAKELAAQGILVNAVCPGLIATEMVHSTISSRQIRHFENSFPVTRMGTPDEVADVVQFLCESASYINGAAIDVNGGDLML